jgi:hypothetical protein
MRGPRHLPGRTMKRDTQSTPPAAPSGGGNPRFEIRNKSEIQKSKIEIAAPDDNP